MLGKSVYLFMSNVVGYGIRILLPIFLVRILPKEDFGAYSQFFLLEVLIKTLFQMGINQGLYYFVPRDKENAGAYLVNTLGLNLVIFSLSYVLVWLFQAQIAAESGMQIILTYFWYLAAHSFCMMLNVTVLTYLTSLQKIRQTSILTILREVLASIGTLLAAYFTRDLKMIFLALVISRALVLVIGLLYLHFGLDGFRAKKYFFGIWQQLRYGLVLGLGGAIWVYSLRFHELMVSRNYDLETFAVYTAGCREIPLLQFIAQSIAGVSLPQFALLVKKEDWEAVRRLWCKVLATMYGVAIPFVLILLAVSHPLVIAMFTRDYAGAIPIFQLKTLSKLGMVVNSTLVLRAMDRNDVTLKVNAAMFVLLPLALYGGMKVYGMVGIAAVNTIFLLLTRVVSQYYLNRLAPVHMPLFPSRRDIAEFYVSAYRKSREWVGGALSRVR